MADYIVIDGGTTNTRISLVLNGAIRATKRFSVGARRAIDGGNLLRDTVRDGIREILAENATRAEDIERIIASGMITSELGLINLSHAVAPVGIAELHKSMHEVTLHDISEIPFAFIRGVKTESKELSDTDMMRGEETELSGLACGEGVYILPGSHSKIILTDEGGRIVSFKTTLTGEMIHALSHETILKSTVDIRNSALDEEYLLKGYRYAERHGINEALFKVRILKSMFDVSADGAYSFFLGAVLSDEIGYVLSLGKKNIVIGGVPQLKAATAMLLRRLSECNIVEINNSEITDISVRGAIKIYEYRE